MTLFLTRAAKAAVACSILLLVFMTTRLTGTTFGLDYDISLNIRPSAPPFTVAQASEPPPPPSFETGIKQPKQATSNDWKEEAQLVMNADIPKPIRQVGKSHRPQSAYSHSLSQPWSKHTNYATATTSPPPSPTPSKPILERLHEERLAYLRHDRAPMQGE
ncbi:hypothetical protein PMZ80_004812 [Knufia obscura]|uniref:Uncharacterized protein n=2 Tax=Knufia TaxID=430999 RepID=A0AAN8ENY6_9EURO|nr:hypothetical protein PMZ80_004812 [Knufia obscura]KAK5952800.1 hypothetical protein OHC33_005919 [Knufia fluminis]